MTRMFHIVRCDNGDTVKRGFRMFSIGLCLQKQGECLLVILALRLQILSLVALPGCLGRAEVELREG